MKNAAKDSMVKLAREQGYRARSAFKLLELNERYHFIRPGMNVIDLGAAPGSWSQACVKILKCDASHPSILAVDILPIDPIPGVKTLALNLSDFNAIDNILKV